LLVFAFLSLPRRVPRNLIFLTNSSTHFENMGGMGMSNRMLLMVDAIMQPDGTMLAQEVRPLMAGVKVGGLGLA
jgi:hypothetical protein